MLYQFDKDFLKRLDYHKNKIVYIKIIALDQNNYPLEIIEGRATGGNINVDGSSAVRRTCSLSIVAYEDEFKELTEEELQKKVPITDVYWSLKNKFKLEVGIQNDIEPKYPKIIWFEQGHFVINNFSKSYSTNAVNVSISGQDKMALLNGTLGGTLPHEIDFGTIDEIDQFGNIITSKIPINEILFYALTTYAKEPLENIIINDLDECVGWELWEYNEANPMFYIYKVAKDTDQGQVINVFFSGEEKVKLLSNKQLVKLSEITKYYSLNTIQKSYNDDATLLEVSGVNSNRYNCYVIKIDTGETAGYHKIDLVYNDDLILKAGEALTTLFDKIKNMLVNFEYFYDIKGRFVFQRKKDYLQELFSPINGDIIEPTLIASPYEYEFKDNAFELFNSFSSSPRIDNIKNDFVIWGSRKGISGTEIPFHTRYAIHEKPTQYKSQPSYQKLYFTYIEKEPYISNSGSIPYILENNQFIQRTDENGYKTGNSYNQILTINKSNIQTQTVNKNLIPAKGNYKIQYKNTTQDFSKNDVKDLRLGIIGIMNGVEIEITSFSFPEEKDENKVGYITIEHNYTKVFAVIRSNGDRLYVPNSNYSIEMYWYGEKDLWSISETNKKNNSYLDGKLFYRLNNTYFRNESNNITPYYFNQNKKTYIQKSNSSITTPGYYYKRTAPIIYSITNTTTITRNGEDTLKQCDWREIIYQMALDHSRHNTEYNFLSDIEKSNMVNGESLYPKGITGYEQYYTDFLGFWRLLYNPDGTEQRNGSNLYEFYENGKYAYWNKAIHLNPGTLPFWFDFLDMENTNLGKYSVTKIGQRPKVINETKVKSIYHKEIPEVQFIVTGEDTIETNVAYSPININTEMKELFSRSSQGTSAIEKTNELFYQHVCLSEGATISAIPIWYLSPNTRIYISGLGDFILGKISYNLNYNGTMSLTCSKVFEQFI